MLVSPITNFNNYKYYQSNCNATRRYSTAPLSCDTFTRSVSFKSIDFIERYALDGNLDSLKSELKYDAEYGYGGSTPVEIVNRSQAYPYACRSGRMNIIKYLHSLKGIDVNVIDWHGETGLHALMQGIFYSIPNEIINEICSRDDVNYTLRDKKGKLALDIAIVWNGFNKPWFQKVKEKTVEQLIQNNDYERLSELLKSPGLEYEKLVSEINPIMIKKFKQMEQKLKQQKTDIKNREEALDATIATKTEQIRKEEHDAAEKALTAERTKMEQDIAKKQQELDKKQKKLDTQKKKLDEEKEEVQKKEATFNSLIEKTQSLIDQGIEDAKDGLRALYNVKTEELPKNMDFEEQTTWVLNVLATRQNKITDTNSETPDKITKAIQDDKGNISLDGLNFLERILDASDKTFSEKDLLDSIASVKGNLGYFDTKKAAMFVSHIAWKDNTIQGVIQKVKNYKVKNLA